MDTIKLVAIDLDGTLLTTDKKIHPEDIETIRLARQQGIHIVFASGRHLDGVKTITGIIGNTDYCISSVGAVVTDADDRLVYTNCIPAVVVHEMLNYLDSIGIYTQAYPPLKQFIFRQRCPYTDFYESQCGAKGIETPDLLSKTDLDSTKILMINEPDAMPDLKAALGKKFPGYPFLLSQPNYLEITNRSASKGDALLKVCDILDIDRKNVLAIGDGEVDLSMLQAVEHSACPNNAIRKVKLVAEYISDRTNDSHAITDIFNHYIFGETK